MTVETVQDKIDEAIDGYMAYGNFTPGAKILGGIYYDNNGKDSPEVFQKQLESLLLEIKEHISTEPSVDNDDLEECASYIEELNKTIDTAIENVEIDEIEEEAWEHMDWPKWITRETLQKREDEIDSVVYTLKDEISFTIDEAVEAIKNLKYQARIAREIDDRFDAIYDM